MKHLLVLSFMALSICFSGLEACVTYSPSTGTYTIDKSGCVDHGQKKPSKAKEKSKPKKDKK